MIDYTRSRNISFTCKLCNGHESHFEVPFGAFIDLNEDVYCLMLEERMGVTDRTILDVVCSKCGCCNGLRFK